MRNPLQLILLKQILYSPAWLISNLKLSACCVRETIPDCNIIAKKEVKKDRVSTRDEHNLMTCVACDFVPKLCFYMLTVLMTAGANLPTNTPLYLVFLPSDKSSS